MSPKRLSGKRALITGSSSGIGAALAREFAMEGADLILTARRKERLEALAEVLRGEFGVEVLVIALDLGEPDAAQVLFDQTEGAGCPVDVLVNNAGFGCYDDFLEISWERQANMMQLNIVALTQSTHLFATQMRSRGHGQVLNVASIGAYSPCPTFAVYAASKAFVRNFTEAFDQELKGTGVRAMVLNPGGTLTEFMEQSQQELKKGSHLFMMSAEECAHIAVRKMLKGRRNVITGGMNNVGMWMLRFVPRRWLPIVTQKAMSSAVGKAS